MLHAEIRHKLGEASQAARLEDILTSTVFGTLFAANAHATMKAWLRKAGILDELDGEMEWYAFWPQLSADGHDVEPDLLIRIGPVLVVIEAKYLSHESSEDQLYQQWHACMSAQRSYKPDVARAIASSSKCVLVYLVSRAAISRARSFLERSSARLPGAALHLLTWEDLDVVLQETEALPRWGRELRELFERRALTAFRGFGAAFRDADRALVMRLARRRPHFARSLRWATIAKPEDLAAFDQLALRKPQFAQGKP